MSVVVVGLAAALLAVACWAATLARRERRAVAAAERLRGELAAAERRQAELREVELRAHDAQLDELRAAADQKLALVAQGDADFERRMQAIAESSTKGAIEFLQQTTAANRQAEQAAASGELEARTAQVKGAVEPIAKGLEQMRGQIEALEQDRRRTEGTVGQMFSSVGEELGRLRLETGQLVSALKRPQVRGAWGEMSLRNIVRAANMTERVDFDNQVTLPTAAGEARLRPDMVVHLPSERDVIVDAKVPLDAYLAAIEATDDDARDGERRRHARQLRSHIDSLGSKRYHEQLDTPAEFTVCFVPNEAVYCAALDQDPSLLEHGAAQRVLIATPSTLLALLYACAYGWRQSSVEQSAREIEAAARELHKRFGRFLDEFQRAGRALGSSVNAFNAAVGSAEGRLLPQLRRIEDAGAGSGRTLQAPPAIETPPRIITAAELADSDDSDQGESPVRAA